MRFGIALALATGILLSLADAGKKILTQSLSKEEKTRGFEDADSEKYFDQISDSVCSCYCTYSGVW